MKLNIHAIDGSETLLAQGDEHNPDEVVIVEDNWYFLQEKVNMDMVRISDRSYNCPYRGRTTWCDLVLADGSVVKNIGWMYPDPGEDYGQIKNRIAFYSRDTSGTIAKMTTIESVT